MILMTSTQEKKQQEVLTTAYEDYAKKLTLHAFFKVHDREVSEDLVQDTFMKTWSYLVKGGRVGTMKAFLYHILNNSIVDEYRKHKTVSLDTLLEKGYEPSDTQSERLFDFLDGQRVVSSIEYIPKKYQKVIQMRYVQGLSLSEMAHISKQSKNTLAVQTHRGLLKLRSHAGKACLSVSTGVLFGLG